MTPPKKTRGRNPGFLPMSEEMMKHFGWCRENGIYIAVIPDWKSSEEWIIEITIKEKITEDPNRYSGIEALKKMYEYYKYYYNKYND